MDGYEGQYILSFSFVLYFHIEVVMTMLIQCRIIQSGIGRKYCGHTHTHFEDTFMRFLIYCLFYRIPYCQQKTYTKTDRGNSIITIGIWNNIYFKDILVNCTV